MEKKAQEFGQIEGNELFHLEQQPGQKADAGQNVFGAAGEANAGGSGNSTDQIILNIADAKTGKLLLRKRDDFRRLSGNPLVDGYRQLNDYLIEHAKIKVRDKATFFRLLAVMINSGLPLVKSLKTLAGQSQKTPRLNRALLQMAKNIEAGTSLSGAMEFFSEIFNEAQIGMVRAGEASGQLNKTLREIAEEVEKSASLSAKIKGALVYPIVIFCLLIVVVFVMMIAVIPQLTKLFAQTGKDLPTATRILIELSNFCVAYWPLVLGVFVGLIVLINIWRKTKNGKYQWDFLLLKLPIFGEIVKKALLAKFARSFGNMLSSGVPIIKSLEIVANALGNDVYKKRLFMTAEDMRRGIPMAENMAESDLFPSMLVNMIEVGEQTAQLENVTMKVAEFYEEDVDNVVKSLTKILEPLIIVVIGVTVGGLVAAIMLPIIQLTNITGGF